MKKTNNLTFGLFTYKGKYFLNNIRDIPIYFKRLGFLLTHGYSPMAKWETFEWFIAVMDEILGNYRYHRYGNIPFPNIPEEEWEKANNQIYDEMLECLHTMRDKEQSVINIDDNDLIEKTIEERNAAKDKFFELFAKNFYNLWD